MDNSVDLELMYLVLSSIFLQELRNYCMIDNRVVVIEFWHGFIDYNYVSLNFQLIPITITKAAYE